MSSIPIELYASTEAERKAGKENGSFAPDGTIRLDINAGDNGQGAVAYALAHEITHFAEQYSPEKFQALVELLRAETKKQGDSFAELVSARAMGMSMEEQYKGLSQDKLYDLAKSEVIAEMCETILSDTDAAARLSRKLQAQDKGLWEKIKDFFTGLVEKLKAAYADMNPDSHIARSMKEAVTQNEAVLNAWVDAVSDSVVNFKLQDGQKNDAQEGVRYSIRSSFSGELQQWFDNTTHDERKVSGKRFLVGTTTDVLKSIGVSDYQIYFGGSKIDKILENNASMSLDTIKQAVQLLADPILIMQSKTVAQSIVLFGDAYTSGGKPVMVSLLLNPKTKSGEILDYAVITSAYGRRVGNIQNLLTSSDIYYVNENKKRTEEWLQALGLQLPSAVTKFGSIKSIPNSEIEVNVENNRFSLRNHTDSKGRTLTEGQKMYFGKSQVRDSNGMLIPVYHTTFGNFFTLDRNHLGENTLGNASDAGLAATSLVGHWFSNKDLSGMLGGKSIESYLNIENPYRTTLNELSSEIVDFSEDAVQMQDDYSNGEYATTREAAEAFTVYLRENGYDGLIIQDEEFGGESYAVLDSEQAKLTTNENPTRKTDMRYSSRTQKDSQIGRLTAQNEKLQQEADYLRQLVQIQKSGNKDFILDRNSVKKQAGKLMASANAKGDTVEFSRMLNDFYHRMHTDSEITWDAMQEDAGAIADWLLEHHQAQRDEYAQSVLDFLKKRRVRLSESQVGDIEYSYGSLSDFKRAIKGSIILDQSANTSLDQLWQEAAAQFPDRFSADTNEADMPDRLADIVRWANSSESTAESEFQYYIAEYRNDLMQQVLGGYWNVQPVESVSDKLKGQIS